MARVYILASALFLIDCSHPAAPLPLLGTVAPFHLTSQSGQDFDSATLSGHIWVADFIFTNCEGPCPRMSAYMRALQKATTDLPDLKMVSFTVDPKRDTPPVLKEYGKNYSADPARWYFLTGDASVLNTIDRDSFKLGTVGAEMDHSTRFVLVTIEKVRFGVITGLQAEIRCRRSPADTRDGLPEVGHERRFAWTDVIGWLFPQDGPRCHKHYAKLD